MKRKPVYHYYLYALAVLFLVAGILNLSEARRMNRIKLFFKDRRTGHLAAQLVYIPRVHSLNEQISWILRELIAGPVDSRYERTLDPNIEIKEVIVQDKIAYVSLDWSFVDSLYNNPTLAIQSVVKSILHNIRGLDDVKILIDGVEPVNTFYGLSLANKKKY